MYHLHDLYDTQINGITNRGKQSRLFEHCNCKKKSCRQQTSSRSITLCGTYEISEMINLPTCIAGVFHEPVKAVGEKRVEVTHQDHRGGKALRAGLPHVVQAVPEVDIVLQGDLPHVQTHKNC